MPATSRRGARKGRKNDRECMMDCAACSSGHTYTRQQREVREVMEKA